MKRITTGLLLAAGALLPVSIAQAQDAPDAPHREHHGGPGRPDGAPRQAPQPGAAQPGGAPRDGLRAGPGGDGGGRFQNRPQGDFGGGRPDDAGRFDRSGGTAGYHGRFQNGDGPRFPGGQGGYRPQPGQPGYQQQSGRPFYPPTGGQGGYRPQPGQPGYHPQPGRPYYPPTGGQGGYRPQPGQPGYRGHDWGRPGGPGFAPGAPRWGNSGYGGGWTRGWRDDRRYDWHSYRAENHFVFNLPRYYAPRGWGYGYRRFDIGVTIGAPLFAEDYWIDDPYDYRLPPAYEPYRWVRYYNDALLIDLRTGYVVDAVYGIFW